MEITAEHMIAPTSAVMLGPTSNHFARTHTHTHTHTEICTHRHMCTHLYMYVFTPRPEAKHMHTHTHLITKLMLNLTRNDTTSMTE